MVGHLGHIHRHRQAERQSEQDGKETHPKRTRNQRKKSELRGGSSRREPFLSSKNLVKRNRLVFQQVARKILLYKLGGNKGDDAWITGNDLADAPGGFLVFGSQLFLREIGSDILQPENFNLRVRSSQLFPVGNLFVKNIFYLCRTQFLHRIGFIHRQHISLFYDFFIKKSQSFRKQEYDNQQNSNARYKTAASQYPFYNLFPNSFHTVLVFYFNNRCKKSLFILR